MKVLESLEIVEILGTRMYRCSECQVVLCPASEDYKEYALKREVRTTKLEPDSLAFPTDAFVLREYFCPKCAVMFEVDMTEVKEKQIFSISLK
jgi:acetone carboxylase gamma subunit